MVNVQKNLKVIFFIGINDGGFEKRKVLQDINYFSN